MPLATLAAWAAVRALEAPTTREPGAAPRRARRVPAHPARRRTCSLIAVVVAARRARRGCAELVPTWIAFAARARRVARRSAAARRCDRSAATPARPATRRCASSSSSAEHAGDLLLVCGVVPLCAVVLLALTRPRDPALRSSLARDPGARRRGRARGRRLRGRARRAGSSSVGCCSRCRRCSSASSPGSAAARRGRAWRTLAVAAAAFAGLIALPIGALATTDALTDNPSLVPLIQVDEPAGLRPDRARRRRRLRAPAVWLPRRAVWLLPVVARRDVRSPSRSPLRTSSPTSRALAQRTLVGDTRRTGSTARR